MITTGQLQWVLFWIAVFSGSGNEGLWFVWIGSLIFL